MKAYETLRRRWKRSGPLVTLPTTVGATVAGISILVAGLLTDDLAARVLGSIVMLLASGAILMSVFVKLTRRRPVEGPSGKTGSVASNLNFALGLGGVLSFGYGTLAIGLEGRPPLPYAWFAVYGVLAVAVSFAVNGWMRGAPFKSKRHQRAGLVTLSGGLLFLALSLAFPFLEETTEYTPLVIESVLVPIGVSMVIFGWSSIRGYV